MFSPRGGANRMTSEQLLIKSSCMPFQEIIKDKMRAQIIDVIFQISRQSDAFEQLEKMYSGLTREELSREVVQVGIMPEVFDHDSSEEKL
jgi:hypothetical protein